MGLEPASVRASTLSNINISETSWPIRIKFHQEQHWGGGLTALGFWILPGTYELAALERLGKST